MFKKWKFSGGGGPGGTCLKFPPWLGYGYFLELHVHIASHDNHEKNQFMGFLLFPIWIWGSTINILATIELQSADKFIWPVAKISLKKLENSYEANETLLKGLL